MTSFQQEQSFGNGTLLKAILWFSSIKIPIRLGVRHNSSMKAQTELKKKCSVLQNSCVGSHLWRLAAGSSVQDSSLHPSLIPTLCWHPWNEEQPRDGSTGNQSLRGAEDVCQCGGCCFICLLCLTYAGTAWVWIQVERQHHFCLLDSNGKFRAAESDGSNCSYEEVVSKPAPGEVTGHSLLYTSFS